MRYIQVAGAVLRKEGKIFAVQRGPGKALAGYWEFPGGKIEQGETPKEALARELQEELLCQVEVGEYITTTEYQYDFGTVALATYECRLLGAEPQLTEHQDSRWLEPAELDELQWSPADIPTVEILKSR